MAEEKSYFFLMASASVILSGVVCLFLDESWTRNFNSLVKIPVYGLVAQTLNYLVTFGIIDILNLVLSCFQSKNSLNVVETKDQIISILLCCFSAGVFYGMIFGLMDIEEDTLFRIKNDFLYEERLCVPIGVLSGMVGGFMNEILRNNVSGLCLMVREVECIQC